MRNERDEGFDYTETGDAASLTRLNNSAKIITDQDCPRVNVANCELRRVCVKCKLVERIVPTKKLKSADGIRLSEIINDTSIIETTKLSSRFPSAIYSFSTITRLVYPTIL